MPDLTKPTNQPEPNEKLVKIFDTEQENEAMVVKGLLESAGIESDLKSIDAVQETFPGVGETVLLVREEDASEAGKIIESYRNLPPSPTRPPTCRCERYTWKERPNASNGVSAFEASQCKRDTSAVTDMPSR